MKYERVDRTTTKVLPYPNNHLTLKYFPHPAVSFDNTPSITNAIKKGRKVTNRASLVPHADKTKTRTVNNRTNRVGRTTKYLPDLDAIQATHHNRLEDDLFPDSVTSIGPSNDILIQREDHTQGTRLKLMIGGAATIITLQTVGVL